MDNLISNQKDIGAKLQASLDKIRTEKLTRDKLTKLQNQAKILYEQFIENDQSLELLENIPSDYGKFFEKAKLVYEAIITNQIQTTSAPSKISDPAISKTNNFENIFTNLEDINPVKKVFKRLKIKVKQFERASQRIRHDESLVKSGNMLKQIVNQLQIHFNSVTALHDELMVDIDDTHVDTVLAQFECWESMFQESMAILAEAEETSDKQGRHNKHSMGNMEKLPLPPITLNKFDGSFKTWKSFASLFETLVDNNTSLNNVQKLQYLKSNLTAEAAKIIQHLDLSHENYDIAWDAIRSRFENRRLLSGVYLDQIFDLPQIQAESSNALRTMYDTITESLHSLRGVGVDIRNWDVLLLHILVPKLDRESRRQYEERISNPKEVQNLADFRVFLEERFQILDAIKSSKDSNKPSIKKSHHGSASTSGHVNSCLKCKGNHPLFNCKQFLALSSDQRWKYVKQMSLCRNCIQSKHLTRMCKSSPCSECGRKHNKVLHDETFKGSEKGPREALLKEFDPKASLTSESSSVQVILATALVKVVNKFGNSSILRALLDSGSQTSLITEEAAQRIGLKRKASKLLISGLGKNAIRPKTSMELNLKPHFESSFAIHVNVHVIPKITGTLPERAVQHEIRYNDILLADPKYNIPASIDILLGADVYGSILSNKLRHGKPSAIETKLGWVITGPIAIERKIHAVTVASLTELNESLRRFWEIEECNVEEASSKSDIDEHFRASTARQSDGRYIVRLPFKNTILLGNSRKRALARFYQMEKYLKNHPVIQNEYHKFMTEYLQLKHMKPCFYDSNNEEGYYLPHHAVFKQVANKPKIRVVFDASAKTLNGNSLNDLLMVGPTIQEKLSSILLRWRTHRFVISADIEKMYRQILIHPMDQKYQKILWRFNPNDPIKEYTLNTVTYGTSAAPYLAIRTLFQLAEDEEHQNLEVAKIIRRDFYVDDLMTGFDTSNETCDMLEQINIVLQRGGFELKKWSSNNSKVIERVPVQNRYENVVDLIKDDSIKTLGVVWNPRLDEFSFRSIINEQPIWTKRKVLSNIAKIYDPNGWLAPVTVKSKFLMQDIWKTTVSWDEELPKNLNKQWSDITHDLKGIQNIKIARYLKTNKDTNVELHGFCDASERAYAADILQQE